ncbi:zinc ribbon domain-containing protein [Acetobacterium tundrae]|nr:zinc ribbon domain-containing protein [Acetobacterium tundrae]
MAKYCPKCYAGLRNDDTVCSNCGAELEKKDIVEEDFTSGVFDHENLSHDVTDKEIVPETVDDETSSEEIVADEIIGDGIAADEVVAEEIVVAENVVHDPGPAQTAPQKSPVTVKTEEVMTLGDWMLTLLLTYIPVVNLIMLIIWSVDEKTNVNKKHFAWAALIFMGIGVVLSIIFSSIVVMILASAMHSMRYY